MHAARCLTPSKIKMVSSASRRGHVGSKPIGPFRVYYFYALFTHFLFIFLTKPFSIYFPYNTPPRSSGYPPPSRGVCVWEPAIHPVRRIWHPCDRASHFISDLSLSFRARRLKILHVQRCVLWKICAVRLPASFQAATRVFCLCAVPLLCWDFVVAILHSRSQCDI